MITTKHLEIALSVAVQAHFGQVDKAGSPYIFHPLRVMNNVYTVEQKILAILHDVVENTEISFSDLVEKGIPIKLIDALRLLTHEQEDSYEDYIKKISSNPLAKAIKMADLNDNRNLSRLEVIAEKDLERVKKIRQSV